MGIILKILSYFLPMLKPSDEGQRRKNLRLLQRHERKTRRRLKKGGIDAEEQKILDDISKSISEALVKLNKF